MKKKLTLCLMPNSGITTFQFSYYSGDGKYTILTDEWETKEVKATNREKLDEARKAINLTRAHILQFEYETDPKKQTEEDANIKRAVEQFFPAHPCVCINGQQTKYTKVPIVNLVDPTLEVSSSFQLLRLEKKVKEILANKNANQLRDICFWAGMANPPETEEEMEVLLIGRTGVLINEKKTPTGVRSAIDVANDFIAAWDNDENPDREIIITVKKAIKHGIISVNSNNGSSIYYLGDTNLGLSEESAIAYMKSNQKVYENIVLQRVKDADSGIEIGSISEKKTTADAKFEANELTPEKRQFIVDECSLLQADGYLESTHNYNTMLDVNLIECYRRGNENKNTGKRVSKSRLAKV